MTRNCYFYVCMKPLIIIQKTFIQYYFSEALANQSSQVAIFVLLLRHKTFNKFSNVFYSYYSWFKTLINLKRVHKI